MRVILLKDFRDLGRAGDLKTVSDGYGRNYLLPRGVAVLATPPEIRKWEERQRNSALRREKEREIALETKRQIESLEMRKTLTGDEKSGAFGSIRKEDILEFLASRGINLPKTSVGLTQPIKKDGEYAVPISLAPHLRASEGSAVLKVIVDLSPQP